MIETCWRCRTPRGALLSCWIVRHVLGYQVHVGYGQGDIIGSDVTEDLDDARQLARVYRAGFAAEGFRDASYQ